MRRRTDNIRGNKISEFYCTCCGKRTIPIYRRAGCEREKGHLKKLYCLNCRAEKNCVEVGANWNYTLEDFKAEFDSGNFTREGLRKDVGFTAKRKNSGL